MKYLFVAALVSWSMLLSAQAEPTTPYSDSPLFAQVGVGLFPNVEYFNAELSATVGYRFSPSFGLGVEYRSTTTHSISIGRSARVLGLRIRRQYQRGWILSLGGGMVLSADQSDDGFYLYEYRSGGYYLSPEFGYQLRWGFTLSVYATSVWGQRFNDSIYNDNNDRYERTGETSTDSFAGFGLKLGFAFPARGKRR